MILFQLFVVLPPTMGPNLFLAFRITNPELLASLREVHYNCVKKDTRLKDLIAPLETAHVGIDVFRVENDRLEEVKTILRDVFDEYKAGQAEDDKRSVTFKGLGMFGETVLFAKPDKGTELLRELHKISREALEKAGIEISGFPDYVPHITLFKSNNHQKEISRECMGVMVDAELGSQDVEDIRLLSIPKARDSTGYYYCEDVYKIAQE